MSRLKESLQPDWQMPEKSKEPVQLRIGPKFKA